MTWVTLDRKECLVNPENRVTVVLSAKQERTERKEVPALTVKAAPMERPGSLEKRVPTEQEGPRVLTAPLEFLDPEVLRERRVNQGVLANLVTKVSLVNLEKEEVKE